MREELLIDSEFSELGWPLSDEERRNLTENLKTHGCLDPILVWANHDNVILDGHNRYEICTAEEISYKIKAIRLETRQDCIDFICNLQLSRRNSSDEHKSYLRGKRYNAEKNESPGRPSKLVHGEPISTAAKIAEETGVSEATVKRDAKFADAVDALAKPVKDAVLTGELGASRAEVQALAELPKAEQRAAVAKVKSGEAESIKEAIAEPPVKEPEKPAEVLDGENKPVPAKFREIFSRRSELRELEASLQAVAKQLDDKKNDPLYAFIHVQGVTADLDNAKRAIRFSKPHGVCGYCKGAGKQCKACKGLGWLPKSIFKQAPAEMRK